MIIHSIVSDYDIFYAGETPKSSIKNVRGGFVEVVNTKRGKEVKSIFSTDPKMYLKSIYQPGSLIK